MTDMGNNLNRLTEVLRLLAADYDDQRAALPEIVALPDEIALNFDDIFQSLDEIAALHQVSVAQIALLTRIDAIFARMSAGDHASFWTCDALRDDPDWQAVRTLARKTLQTLDQPVRPPRLDWVHYVPGR